MKTPTTVKDIPQWELAAEVTPYVKTDDGTIPSIIVEVREGSLVKAFMPAGNNNKENGLEASSVKSISNLPNVVGDPKGDSSMGLEALTNSLPVHLLMSRLKPKKNLRNPCTELLMMVAVVMKKEHPKLKEYTLKYMINQFTLLLWM